MKHPRTLLVGLGSPVGDDQLGWLVADLIATSNTLNHLEIRLADSPSDLLDWLEDIDRLVICDACRGLGRVGEVRRWNWPTPELPVLAWSGTHDLSLPAVLMLAQRLGRLPEQVVVWAIEGAASGAAENLSAELSTAVSALVNRIIEELNAETTLQDKACTSIR
jgi:hydrogenase maturation protease